MTATDTATSFAGTSNVITVAAAATAKFAVTGSPTTITAGGNVNFTVTAEDTFGNRIPNYAGTVHLTSTDPAFTTASGNSTLTNGIGTFAVALKTAGPQTLSATDVTTGSIQGTSNSILVNAGAAVSFGVVAPSGTTAMPSTSP